MTAPLIEGEDYYVEDGKYVFTERYHLKRGSCCGSGCRHCPYGRKAGSTTPRPLGPIANDEPVEAS
ncbi:MAG: DUF5522 domain-containing protein [Polyangiaceae bacterium]